MNLNERIQEVRRELKAAYNNTEDAFDRLGSAVVDFMDLRDEVVEHLEEELNGYEGEELTKKTEILDFWRTADPESIDTELSHSADYAFGEINELPLI